MNFDKNNSLHINYDEIVKIIEPNMKILDLGCGDGTLLKRLVTEKNIKGKGIDFNQENVVLAIKKGLSVIQGNIDEGLADFLDDEMDYVILNQTLQSAQNPDYVIREMLRVGKKAVVSFPNFAYWRIRLYLLFKGKMPKSSRLPFDWFDTPNIHLLTVKDFFDFCKNRKIKISKSIYTHKGKVLNPLLKSFFADILAEDVLFVIQK
jgi:methionine biosynthesis protein MetW